MKNDTKFEYTVIENKELIENTSNPIRTSMHQSNPMLENFLKFRQAKKFRPKDLI